MPAPATIEQFLEVGKKSGAVEAGVLEEYVQQLRTADRLPETLPQLAHALVRDGLLTTFQAEQFLQGKWRRFVISGKYVLLGRLGAGGMGAVFLCEHKVMRRRVALKMLPTAQSADPASLERFRREARAAAALDHPNIVRAYDIDRDGPLHFLVMEFVDGCGLDEMVRQNGRLDIAQACRFVRQAALGLQHAHEAGLVHRDIKPANLLVDRQGVVKILDMGLARFFHEEEDKLTHEQDANVILGTADYLSPEQALDSHSADIRSDIYSLGLTFYFLVSGESAFEPGKSMAEKLFWHQLRMPKPLNTVRPDAPEGLAAVIEKMIAKNPFDRHQTPGEVALALAPWAQAPAADATVSPTSALTPTHPTAVVADWPFAPSLALAGQIAVNGRVATDAPDVVRRKSPWWIAGGVLFGALCAASVVGLAALGPAMWSGAAAKPAGRPAVRCLEGHTGVVECVAVAPDGRALSGGQDKTMRLWDLAGGKCLRTFTGFQSGVNSVAFSADGALGLAASDDGTVRLWDLTTGDEVRRFDGHTAAVKCAAFSHDGARIVTASMDQTLRIWDAATGREIAGTDAHGTGAWWAGFSPDDRYVFSAERDGTAQMWDASTLEEMRTFEGHTSDVRRLALSADGRRLLTSSFDGTMRLWEVETGRSLQVFNNGGRVAESCGFAPDGRSAFSTEGPVVDNFGVITNDQGVRVWDLEQGTLLYRLGGATGKVLQTQYMPDGRSVVSACGDSLLRVWRLPE